MKMIRKTAVLLMAIVVAFAVSGASAFADSTKIDGEATFNGNEIESTLDSGDVVKAFNDLQPGDDITVSIKYENDYGESTDWYMANEVVQTLEKTDQARKQVEGTGAAENGGYTYSLTHTDKNGTETVLFSNDEVGGDAKPANMEGLEQATNALDEWFYIQTLTKGQSGRVVLNVEFDGETEVNDYMDTDGGLAVRFAVELNRTGTNTTTGSGAKVGVTAVQTGDPTNFPLLFGVLVAGVVLLIVALVLRKKVRGTDTDETGGEE